jgi:photosystem II stability/assembly factor-like uncharacterized protein
MRASPIHTLIAALATALLLTGCQDPDPISPLGPDKGPDTIPKPDPKPDPQPNPAAPFLVDTADFRISTRWQNPIPLVNGLRSAHFPAPNTGWFAGRRGALLKTADGGKTFTVQDAGDIDFNSVRFFDAERGIAVGELGLIAHTTDGGAQWKTQILGGTALRGLCLSGTGVAVAVGDLGTVLKSTDGGKSWSLKNSGTTSDIHQCDFMGPDSIQATGQNYDYTSGDRGESWSSRPLGSVPESYWFQVLLDQKFLSATLGYALHNGKPHITRNGGAAWEPWFGPGEALPGSVHAMAFTQGRAVVVGGGGLIYHRSLDGETAPWFAVQTATKSALLTVHFPTPDTGYAASERGDILRTTDAGLTWTACGKVATQENLTALHFVNERFGFAVGLAGTLLRTRDGGESWTLLPPPATRDFQGVHFVNETVGCVVGVGGTALWTRDAGETWALSGTGIPNDLRDVHLIDERTAYAGVAGWDDQFVLRTLDGGASWTGLRGTELLSDGLLYYGRRFHEADDNLILRESINGLYEIVVRANPGSPWSVAPIQPHQPGNPITHTPAGTSNSLFYALTSEQNLIHRLHRIDGIRRTIATVVLRSEQALRDISCPQSGTCFAVGDQGVILKLSLP